jgi:internalin A
MKTPIFFVVLCLQVFTGCVDNRDSQKTADAEESKNPRMYYNAGMYWGVDDLSDLLENHIYDKSIEVLEIDGDLSDISSISSLTNLKELSLQNCDNITDISPLRSLVNLEKLVLSGCHHITSIEPLSELKNLKHLSLSTHPRIHEYDFYSLRNLTGLQFLSIGGFAVDVSYIAQLTSLTSLHITFFEGIDNVSLLQNLVELRELNLFGEGQLDLEWITKLVNLERAGFENFEIADVSPLVRLPKLTHADFYNSVVHNFSDLFESDSIEVIIKPLNDYEQTDALKKKEISIIPKYDR